MPKKTPQHILDAIVEAYLDGLSMKEAAALYGLTGIVCGNELKLRGIQPRSKSEALLAKRRAIGSPLKTPQHILDAIVEAYLDGMTTTEAAAKYGKHRTVCTTELRKRGIPCRRVGALKTPQHILDAIVEAYLSGLSSSEATAKFDLCETVCLNELKKRGIPRRNDRKAAGLKCSATKQKIPLGEWVGYATDPWKRVRDSFEWRDWRLSVFRRDAFSCAECGQKAKARNSLHAHHIFRKSVHPHMLFEVSNGITLCKVCHDSIRGQEEKHAARYLAKIGSTIAPIVFYESRSSN